MTREDFLPLQLVFTLAALQRNCQYRICVRRQAYAGEHDKVIPDSEGRKTNSSLAKSDI
jgi:hypothetical protein